MQFEESKMKKVNSILFGIAILLIGCKEPKKSSEINVIFSELHCSPEPTPKFDGNKVTILDKNQNPLRDTIISQIEKRREVFKPCREIIFRAIWNDKSGNEITNSRIKMMATGKRWDMQPEKQDEVIIQVEYSEKDIEQTKKHQLNKQILDRRWMDKGIEGVIENTEEIWMHPFRFNQFNFTEVAPFPEIKFPLSVGKTWTGQLRIMEGWGDWTNTSGNFKYEVISKEMINTKYGTIENCWHINSESKYPFGSSTFEYWFHESFGFVKKVYKNYGNQILTIELEEIKEKSM
jgi:hypothetical protein